MTSLRLNAFMRIILSIINIIIPIIVGPYIIRMLSKSSYDIFSKAAVELQLFLSLATLGVYTYGIRTISRIRKEQKEVQCVYSELFAWGFIFNISFFVIYILYVLFISNGPPHIIYYILMVQFLGSAINVEWMNEAKEDYKFIVIKSIIIKVIYIACIFIFIKGDRLGVYGLIVSLAFVVENIISFIFITKKNKISLRKLNLRRHLRPLLLVFLITNISLLYAQSDKIMLGLLAGEHAVAVYTIPHYITVSIYNVIVSVIVVAVPRLCSLLGNKDNKSYTNLYNELFRTFYMVFIPMLVFIYVGASDIIGVYAAGKYNESILPLQIFVVALMFNSMVYIEREGVLYLYEREKSIIIGNIIGGIINFGFNITLYLLGLFNPVNAALSLAFSYLLVAVLLRLAVIKVNKQIKGFSFRVFLYMLFSLPLFVLDYFIEIHIAYPLLRLLLLGVFGVPIYILFLLLSNDKVFINNIKTTVRKVKAFKNKV